MNYLELHAHLGPYKAHCGTVGIYKTTKFLKIVEKIIICTKPLTAKA